MYAYEYLDVHIRDSGCTQKSVYLFNILAYRYFILTFYNKRELSSISGESVQLFENNLSDLCTPPLKYAICILDSFMEISLDVFQIGELSTISVSVS